MEAEGRLAKPGFEEAEQGRVLDHGQRGRVMRESPGARHAQATPVRWHDSLSHGRARCEQFPLSHVFQDDVARCQHGLARQQLPQP